MKPVFVDTSYYVALFGPRDRHHAKAVHLWRTLGRPTIVTEFVLLELGNAMARGDDRRLFTDFLPHLQADPDALIIPASPALFAQGCKLFTNRPDKNWSLTDCTSFVVMKEHGVTDALTTDRHFAQAGYNVLLQ